MKVVLIGMGESGQGAKKLCEHFGYEYECIDADRSKGLPERMFIPDVDLYVLSPGIPPSHPQIRHAITQNTEWIGEAEFALRHAQQRVIGITGTNGKSTVVSLLAHILPNAIACGNIGLSLSQAVIEADPKTLLVAELSSYQLETMTTPLLDAGAILNIEPDHLDRYTSMQEYAFAKLRMKHALREKAPLYVSRKVFEEWGKEIPNATIVDSLDIESGVVGKENASFAFMLSNLSKEAFLTGVMTYKKLPHRIEFVKNLDGISFYDDSKGTNVAAVLYALSQMRSRVVLIAGGRGKGESFRPLLDQGLLKAVVAIGEAKEQIYEELSSDLPVELAITLEEAVQKAYATAESSEVVLLSPGCASLDMFSNYKHRGEVFKTAVRELSSSPVEKQPLAADEQYMLF